MTPVCAGSVRPLLPLCFVAFALSAAAAPPIDSPRLDPMLRDMALAGAAGPEAAADFARRHGLKLDGDRALVAIETAALAEVERDTLAAAGAVVMQTASSSALAWVPLARLSAVASLPRVLRLRRPVTPVWSAITSQGVALTGASRMLAAGHRGAGVRIGVVDSFRGYGSRVGNELPPADRVIFRSFTSNNGEGDDDHGVRVAEVLADMAPDATLYFAAIDDDIGYRNAVAWLVSQGVRVINHSGGFGLYGDMKGNGPVHGAIAAAAAAGVFYVEAAGNNGRSHWEGNFRDDDRNGELEFAPGVERLSFRVPDNGAMALRVDLTWDDWVPDPADPRPTADFDLCLYDAAGKQLSCSRATQTGRAGEAPYEEVSFTVPSGGMFSIGVSRKSGGDLRLEVALMPDYDFGSLNVASSSIIAPADHRDAFTVGATTLGDVLRTYSSIGPTNDGRLKPELVGPDGVATSLGTFFGTSAAAPHVAGAAAQMLSKEPGLSAIDLRDRLQASGLRVASDTQSRPNSSFGHGRLQADLAGGLGTATPTATPTPTPTPIPTPTPARTPAPSSGGGGGCRLVDPAHPGSPLELLMVALVVLAYGRWLGRRP